MRCESVMKERLECASPQDTVQQAATRMREHNVGFLPVCDSSGRVIGAITDRDLAIRILAEGRPASTPLTECMTREVVSCQPEDDLRQAEARMARTRKSRILCIDGAGRLVGVISLSDIAQREHGARASQTLRDVSAREARV